MFRAIGRVLPLLFLSAAANAGNLIADPGFEAGTSGFTAPSSSDSATRSTTAPIDGTASLSVSLKSIGSEVVWSQAFSASTAASMYTVSAKLRPDTISNWTTLHLCAEAVYANELGAIQKCVPAPTVAGNVYMLSVAMPIDPTKTLASVTFQVILRSATAVVFELDDVSAELTPAGP